MQQRHTKRNKRLSPWIGKSLFFCLLAMFGIPFGLVQLTIPSTLRVMDGTEYGNVLWELEPEENEWISVSENQVHQNTAIEGEDKQVVPATVKLWGLIPVKSVSLEIWQEQDLLVGGHTIGIDLYTDGILVLGTGKVETADGEKSSPSRGILRAGDRIDKVNGQPVSRVEQVDAIISKAGQKPVRLTIRRGDETLEVSITPILDKDDVPRIGIWIRDRAQGLGTLTFVNPEDQIFGAVGHGIADVDTGAVLPIHTGVITQAKIRHIVKGEEGLPGEVEGSLTGLVWGQVKLNSEYGVYGKFSGDMNLTGGNAALSGAYPIVLKDQVRNGDAQIISDILGGSAMLYDVKIEKASGLPTFNTGMVVTITDERLLQQTGGIIQGMSGCPIIQNGKLIGAVTHVFVKDPTKGYGIYIEDMLEEAEKIG